MTYHPSAHARSAPDKPAIIMGETGRVVTYRELDEISNRFAQLVRSRDIAVGNRIAICMENHPLYLAVCWGAQRAGLILVAISSRLSAPEVAYILEDSDAKLLVGSAAVGAVLDKVAETCPHVPQLRFGGGDGLDLEAALRAMPAVPIADERAGCDMLYSSGTTGKPKGVRSDLPAETAIGALTPFAELARSLFGIGPQSIFLSPAPLYHSAPLRWCMAIHRFGGTVVVMEKFDAEKALALIDTHGVTDSQWVPTHFVRLLALPEEIRSRYRHATLRQAIHAAAPCPAPVKKAMIDWWGPIINEFYAGTEANGMTYISSLEALARPGSVGRPVMGKLHICDEYGDEVPVGTEGGVYFESETGFSYHNDPEKTRDATNKHGWTTIGDVGRVDDEGYLYLTDRKSFMIISGGVNIYPQEIENLLIMHPGVVDVAVFGAPDPEMGERVVAVVQPRDMTAAGPALAVELTDWLGPQLSRVKMPRQIDFRAELPREPTGKLMKRLLRDEYWAGDAKSA